MKTCRCVRGETTAQVVVMMPVVLFLLLIGVHFASYLHASNVANAAAKRSAQVAAGMPDAGQAYRVASNSVSDMTFALGSQLASPTNVAISNRSVSVTVHVRLDRLLPFLPDTVTRRGMARRELFMTEDQR